jgi:hypothetical protein
LNIPGMCGFMTRNFYNNLLSLKVLVSKIVSTFPVFMLLISC